MAAFANGDVLYLSTGGALVNAAPGSGAIARVGIVTAQASDKFLIQVGPVVSL